VRGRTAVGIRADRFEGKVASSRRGEPARKSPRGFLVSAMRQPDARSLIEALAAARRQVVVVTTGGARRGGRPARGHARGQSRGARKGSCRMPAEAIDRLLGGPQEGYCSSRTAAGRLAVMAWQRACGYGATPEEAIGAGRDGEPQDHGAQTRRASDLGGRAATLDQHGHQRSSCSKRTPARGLRRKRSPPQLLERLAEAGAGVASAASPAPGGRDRRCGYGPRVRRPSADLFAGRTRRLRRSERLTTALPRRPSPNRHPGRLIFPARSTRCTRAICSWRRSPRRSRRVRPVDYYELLDHERRQADARFSGARSRIVQFSGQTLWLTRAARTFLEKLDLFRGDAFVIGAEPPTCGWQTRGIRRLARGGGARAIERIAADAAGLIVFGGSATASLKTQPGSMCRSHSADFVLRLAAGIPLRYPALPERRGGEP